MIFFTQIFRVLRDLGDDFKNDRCRGIASIEKIDQNIRKRRSAQSSGHLTERNKIFHFCKKTVSIGFEKKSDITELAEVARNH